MAKYIQKIEPIEPLNYTGYAIHLMNSMNYIPSTISFLIRNNQYCCEDYGTIVLNEDNLSYYYGQELLNIKIVKTNAETATGEELYFVEMFQEWLPGEFQDENNVVFLELETPLGPIDFGVYNYHNGAYGHKVEIRYDEDVLLRREI